MTDDFARAAADIEANPLGRLMYGQRELFHSNLLAWFFDTLPGSADAVFRPLSAVGSGTPRRVERERDHLDLVMHWPDAAPLVIENKVFSLPSREQLTEYAAKTERWPQRPASVLLSASPPDFPLEGWRYLSYAALGDRIDEALPDSGDYEVETMRRYAALARDVDALVSAVAIGSTDEPVWLPDALLEVLSNKQMRAALQKARAQRVAQAINHAIPTLERPAHGGMSNATPLAEALEYVHAHGVHVHLGWQLQGRQFRRAAVYHDQALHGHAAESRARREAVSREHPHFFAFPQTLPQTTSGRKEFNHFAPNFVYRYVAAPSLTVGELIKAATAVHDEIAALRRADAPLRPPGTERRTP